MKICIPKEGENISQHFGQSPEFAIFTIENGAVISKEILKSPGHNPHILPEFLAGLGVTHIITCGMGKKMQEMFLPFNITVYTGVIGKVDDTIQKFLEGSLFFGQQPV
ncbi:dinitrogenase iron-molybdenum cofactor [Methanocella sp. CWC-04]|uniref:Dinitrogenase iron-molybdenum cofactor n=1 Tax=Methanooceanicella nereidis TaxID=2052831 RepID=A0AAP2W5H5_9EURY|nr:NifB/NifX family molybdenum-iron cluster-binding protein [Methanocella sp. CWC-04]MCD1294313.1 dinitrogenase iron-molybdenum cofactor [Methanocella sp. CWC-04]